MAPYWMPPPFPRQNPRQDEVKRMVPDFYTWYKVSQKAVADTKFFVAQLAQLYEEDSDPPADLGHETLSLFLLDSLWREVLCVRYAQRGIDRMLRASRLPTRVSCHEPPPMLWRKGCWLD